MVPGARAHGLGSREEHVELSGDLGGRPAIEVDCLLKRDSLLCLIGLWSRLSAVFLSGLRWVLESRRLKVDAESGLKESLLALRPENIPNWKRLLKINVD